MQSARASIRQADAHPGHCRQPACEGLGDALLGRGKHEGGRLVLVVRWIAEPCVSTVNVDAALVPRLPDASDCWARTV